MPTFRSLRKDETAFTIRLMRPNARLGDALTENRTNVSARAWESKEIRAYRIPLDRLGRAQVRENRLRSDNLGKNYRLVRAVLNGIGLVNMALVGRTFSGLL